MTENERILSTLQNGIVCSTDDITREDLEMMVKCLEELQQYRAIGTIEEFNALKEKNEPKKPKSNKVIFSHDSYVYCPHCKHCIELFQPSHCDSCGGELDWQ